MTSRIPPHELHTIYQLSPEKVTPEFVSVYGSKKRVTVFRNLNESCKANPQDRISELTKRIASAGPTDRKNLLRQLVGLKVLGLLGYPIDRLDHELILSDEELGEKFVTIGAYIKDNLELVRSVSYSRRHDDLERFDQLVFILQLRVVDSLIRRPYGLAFWRITHDENKISQAFHFRYSESENKFTV